MTQDPNLRTFVLTGDETRAELMAVIERLKECLGTVTMILGSARMARDAGFRTRALDLIEKAEKAARGNTR